MYSFNNQMFNPQYVNQQYYQTNLWQIQQYNYQQDVEVAKAVKAMRDLIEATKKLDEQHQRIAFLGCMAEIGKENKW